MIFFLQEFSDLCTLGIFPYHTALVLSILIVMHNIDITYRTTMCPQIPSIVLFMHWNITTGGPSSRLEKKPTINSWKRHALCDSVLSYERNRWKFGELLRHGRRAGKEKKTEIRVVSGETTLILHIETYQL